MVEEQPKWRTGKICYVEIPAVDAARSAGFYQQAFGWRIRQRGDGSTSFDDTVGEVSGTFVVGRPPATEPGFGIYIMVADAEADPGGGTGGGRRDRPAGGPGCGRGIRLVQRSRRQHPRRLPAARPSADRGGRGPADAGQRAPSQRAGGRRAPSQRAGGRRAQPARRRTTRPRMTRRRTTRPRMTPPTLAGCWTWPPPGASM